jgi:hypothetical protein
MRGVLQGSVPENFKIPPASEQENIIDMNPDTC